MKTVRELFSKAFGDVPDGATCHIASHNYRDDCHYVEATVEIARIIATRWQDGGWRNPYDDGTYNYAFGPDISDRPTESFRGFFGAEYDNALDAEGEK